MAEHDNEIDALLRSMTRPDVQLDDPPSDLWDRIEAEAGLTETAEVAPVADVISLASRRRPATTWLLTSAAAAVLVAIVGFAVVTSSDDDDPELLAVAPLAYDAEAFDPLGAQAFGEATLLDDGGTFVVDLAMTTLPVPQEDADLELWLIQPDADGNVADLVSLGIIDPENPGTITVPSTHDPATYFVVDISVEPRAGVATHSGRSILRGPLDTV